MIRRTVIAGVVAIATLLAASSQATAAVTPSGGATTAKPQMAAVVAGHTPGELAPLAPYVREGAGGYSLTAVPASVVAQVGQERIATLKEYWAVINPILVAESRTVRAYGPSAVGASSATSISPYTRWSGPHGYVETRWFGLEVGIDKYAVDKLTSGGASAAGIAALLGVPAAVAVVILAAVAIIKVCQKSSGWAYIYQVFGVWGCNPF